MNDNLEDLVKYWHVNKGKKWNEFQVENQFLGSIFSGAWTPNYSYLFLKF